MLFESCRNKQCRHLGYRHENMNWCKTIMLLCEEVCGYVGIYGLGWWIRDAESWNTPTAWTVSVLSRSYWESCEIREHRIIQCLEYWSKMWKIWIHVFLLLQLRNLNEVTTFWEPFSENKQLSSSYSISVQKRKSKL